MTTEAAPQVVTLYECGNPRCRHLWLSKPAGGRCPLCYGKWPVSPRVAQQPPKREH